MAKRGIDEYKDRMTSPIGIVITSKPTGAKTKKKTKKGKK